MSHLELFDSARFWLAAAFVVLGICFFWRLAGHWLSVFSLADVAFSYGAHAFARRVLIC